MQYLINNFQNKLKQTPNSSAESNFAYSWLFYNKSNSCSVIRVLFSAWSVSQFLPQFIILNLEFKQQESDTEQAPRAGPSPDVFKVSEPGQWSAPRLAIIFLLVCLVSPRSVRVTSV